MFVTVQRLTVVHVRYATTAMRMPAMSPTMTEGGIAGWKVNEGDAFAAGDVLLEIVSARHDARLPGGRIANPSTGGFMPIRSELVLMTGNGQGDD